MEGRQPREGAAVDGRTTSQQRAHRPRVPSLSRSGPGVRGQHRQLTMLSLKKWQKQGGCENGGGAAESIIVLFAVCAIWVRGSRLCRMGVRGAGGWMLAREV